MGLALAVGLGFADETVGGLAITTGAVVTSGAELLVEACAVAVKGVVTLGGAGIESPAATIGLDAAVEGPWCDSPTCEIANAPPKSSSIPLATAINRGAVERLLALGASVATG